MTEPKAGRNGEPGGSGSNRNEGPESAAVPPGAVPNGAMAAGAGPHGAMPGPNGTGPNGSPRGWEAERFLVAARPVAALPPGIAPLEAGRLAEFLEATPGVRVIGRIGEVNVAPGLWPPVACPPVLVVEAPAATAVQWMSAPQVIVEPDAPLAYSHPNPVASPFAAADPAVLLASGDPEQVTVVVRGSDDNPIPGAAVYLTGGAWPVSGSTDKKGRVTLGLPADGAVRRLWVRPRAGYWPVVVDASRLSAKGEAVVVATPLEATFEGFPKRKAAGWAGHALRLHEIAPTFRGHGVKIALIDSGVATTHPELDGRIAAGMDVLTGSDRTWAVDTVGHGTACAGIISAADNEEGIAGLAVDAQVHAVKVMPGGRVSHLLQALDYCMRHQVDVAQISVGTMTGSELVALKIADARNAGILCVAPAGNTSGGPVIYPAVLPTVLAVGAVGRVGTFPADSRTPVDAWSAGRDGVFVPDFTATGQEVDVCAPGVAVISTVPPDGYAPLDGTGVAAAHVTALAGLVLAHHHDFRDPYTRGPARVDRLTNLIMASCQPVAAHRSRTGAGMPDARHALATVEPMHPNWAGAVLSQLHADLARAGLIPAGPAWPPA